MVSPAEALKRRVRSGQSLRVETLEGRRLLTTFSHLNPGGPVEFAEVVPVNFVFVGYESDQVDEEEFLAALPSRYDPLIPSRLFYGETEHLGLHYFFDHRITYTNSAFEDAFFGALRELAVLETGPRGSQLDYNDQDNNVLDVTGNFLIDAPSVEKWLAANAPTGVDTTRDTIFFVNWWGRDDFLFHLYTKPGEPDPDTGRDFAELFSRDLIAWGGTTADDEETGLGSLGTHRIWFHDLSAGPDYKTGSWNVDDVDLDFDGVPDYRMPPVWEYLTPGGYRPADALTGDLAKIARYVGIDLLFTPSPAFPPYLTPDRLPDAINLDLNTYEAIPGVDASSEFIDPALLVQELRELYRVPISVDQQDLALEGEALESFLGYVQGWYEDVPPNYEELGNFTSFANLFYDAALKLDELLDGPGSGSWLRPYVYEAVAINYAVPDELTSPFPLPFLGLADDNYQDGTQSFVYALFSPDIEDAGYGLTTTLIHEYGHHFGLNHPHDGYDPAVGYYGPGGDFYFAWTGDLVNSMMSYIDLNWDFSQFDRDNANRYFASAYIRSANRIAGDILSAARTPLLAMLPLRVADSLIGLSKLALFTHNYELTFDLARSAYRLVLLAADLVRLEVTPSNAGRTIPPITPGTGADRSALALKDDNHRWPERAPGPVDQVGRGRLDNPEVSGPQDRGEQIGLDPAVPLPGALVDQAIASDPLDLIARSRRGTLVQGDADRGMNRASRRSWTISIAGARQLEDFPTSRPERISVVKTFPTLPRTPGQDVQPAIEQPMRMSQDALPEEVRGRYAAIEAADLGHEGIAYVAALLGCVTKAVRRGQHDPDHLPGRRGGRARKRGADAGVA